MATYGAMQGIAKTAALTIVLALFGAGTAAATEIARPHQYKVPFADVAGGKRTGSLVAETRSGLEAGYLVIDRIEIGRKEWVGVRVGKRPNDRIGWVRKSNVQLVKSRYLIDISLDKRTMSLFKGTRELWKKPVIIGKPSTPTPRGLFAIHDFYRVRNDLRPWQIELTAHSEVLDTFMGGPARVAIHGRHGSLRDPLGTRSSNGCIRALNRSLNSIERLAPIGTPVNIR